MVDSKIFREFGFLSSIPTCPTWCLQLLESLEVVECSGDPTNSPVPFLSYSLSPPTTNIFKSHTSSLLFSYQNFCMFQLHHPSSLSLARILASLNSKTDSKIFLIQTSLLQSLLFLSLSLSLSHSFSLSLPHLSLPLSKKLRNGQTDLTNAFWRSDECLKQMTLSSKVHEPPGWISFFEVPGEAWLIFGKFQKKSGNHRMEVRVRWVCVMNNIKIKAP